MSSDLSEKINYLIENDDTENFYSLISEIIEENKDYLSDLNKNLNEAFKIISSDLNESNQEKKMPFICLFFEILISENLDFSFYLEKTFSILNQKNIYSDESIKRIINICSNASIRKKDLFNNLVTFSKNKIDYLYIIFSLAGFKDIIIDNLSDNWELIIDLLDNPENKSNSNNIKKILKCLELLIDLSETKFRPYASSALYQALDYLTETDIELQKRSLMIIYSLTKYCDEQLKPLSDNIIDFLKVLQNGNNIEINNLCNTMLKHFNGELDNDNENENENEENNYEENENENEINDSNGNNIENNAQNEINDYENENENEHNMDNIENENMQNNLNVNNNNKSEKKDYLQKKYVPEERQEKEDEEEDAEGEGEGEVKQKYNDNDNDNEQENEDEEDNKNKYNYKNDKNEINEEEEEENKYNYKKAYNNKEEDKKQISNKKEKNDIEKDNNIYNKNDNNILNNIDINAIIRKIKDLSDKQIIILDSIEQYKRDTKRIINQKKLKIQALEAKIEELQEKIRIEKNKKRNKQGKTNYQMRKNQMNNNNNNDYDDENDKYNDYHY